MGNRLALNEKLAASLVELPHCTRLYALNADWVQLSDTVTAEGLQHDGYGAAINIFNGMISLTFSCDRSHYVTYDEFLRKDMSFWLGIAA
jgi:hypothetical protein